MDYMSVSEIAAQEKTFEGYGECFLSVDSSMPPVGVWKTQDKRCGERKGVVCTSSPKISKYKVMGELH